jgi:hypothetical protein
LKINYFPEIRLERNAAVLAHEYVKVREDRWLPTTRQGLAVNAKQGSPTGNIPYMLHAVRIIYGIECLRNRLDVRMMQPP